MNLQIGDVMSLRDAEEIEQIYMARKLARLREQGYDVQFERDYGKRFEQGVLVGVQPKKPAPFSFWKFFWTALGSSAFFWFLIRSWR